MDHLDPTRRAHTGLSRLVEPGAAERPDPTRDDSGLER
jgi:hypothetical protein